MAQTKEKNKWGCHADDHVKGAWVLTFSVGAMVVVQEGASWLFADAWEDYEKQIPEAERGDMIQAYYNRLTGDDPVVRDACALAWSKWEMATSKLKVHTAQPFSSLLRLYAHPLLSVGSTPFDSACTPPPLTLRRGSQALTAHH